jgi:hypothetical protein
VTNKDMKQNKRIASSDGLEADRSMAGDSLVLVTSVLAVG